MPDGSDSPMHVATSEIIKRYNKLNVQSFMRVSCQFGSILKCLQVHFKKGYLPIREKHCTWWIKPFLGRYMKKYKYPWHKKSLVQPGSMASQYFRLMGFPGRNRQVLHQNSCSTSKHLSLNSIVNCEIMSGIPWVSMHTAAVQHWYSYGPSLFGGLK